MANVVDGSMNPLATQLLHAIQPPPGGGYTAAGRTDVLPQRYPPGYGTDGALPAGRNPAAALAAGTVPQAPGGPTLGAYHTHSYAPLPPGQDPAVIAARQNQIHNQATAYATQRFNQMRRIAHALPPELQAALRAALQNPDAAAAWREYSGHFAAASLAAGYQDPRYWLQVVLPQQARPGGPQAQ